MAIYESYLPRFEKIPETGFQSEGIKEHSVAAPPAKARSQPHSPSDVPSLQSFITSVVTAPLLMRFSMFSHGAAMGYGEWSREK